MVAHARTRSIRSSARLSLIALLSGTLAFGSAVPAFAESGADVDASLAVGASITGTISGALIHEGFGGVNVYSLKSDNTWDWVRQDWIPDAGTYSVTGLPAGTYTMMFTDQMGFGGEGGAYTGPAFPVEEWWNDKPDQASATRIVLSEGQQMTGANVDLTSTGPAEPAILTAATPTVSGAAIYGGTLTAKTGAWTTGTTFTYQWLADGATITGATSSTFKLGTAQKTKQISVTVTGKKTGYATVSKTSANTTRVATVGAPTITGTPVYGGTLTAKAGTWTSSTAFAYQWLANGVKISGATKSTFKLSSAQKSKQISVTVTGKKSGYTTVAKTSAKTAKVAVAPTPTISGTPKVGKKLTAKPGTWVSGTALTYQWYASGKAISKATKSTLTLTSAQRGKAITVKVTGKKSGYPTVAKTSKATAKVS